jgi:hypothetical protein
MKIQNRILEEFEALHLALSEEKNIGAQEYEQHSKDLNQKLNTLAEGMEHENILR